MTKAILHIINYETIKTAIFKEDLELLNEIYESNWIENIFFYLEPKEEEKEIKIEYENSNDLLFFYYESEKDLEKKVLEINNKYDIIFVNTLLENEIQLTNKIRKLIWQKVSDFPEMFNNKAIQRELLYKNDSIISVKFLKSDIKHLNYNNIVEKIWLPFVLKPSNWVQSSWVAKIKSEKSFNKYLKNYTSFHLKLVNKWVSDIDETIAEEYVNGKFYSIDYYVDQEWEIFISKPVRVTLWTDLWINDFFNSTRIISKDIEKENEDIKILEFIKRNVKATWIRNTFIHQEFKKNSKWLYKTIEINWRIGWRRLTIYKLWYDINLYSFLLKKRKDYSIKSNLLFVRVYAIEWWILEWFNNSLFEKIEKLNSFLWCLKKTKYINKEVWLTKYWFEYIATIRLKNDNLKIFNKDLKFIEDNYKDLLIIKKD